jgi:hypothetical protein
MEEFYKMLLGKSKPTDNGLSVNFDDITKGFEELGYYRYEDCCGCEHFQKTPFSEEQIRNIEKAAKSILDSKTEEITKAINKQILEDLMAENYGK